MNQNIVEARRKLKNLEECGTLCGKIENNDDALVDDKVI